MFNASTAISASRPTIQKDVDANNDGVFSDSENVPKNVTYPWTVTYRLTINAGSFSSHKIVAITDSTTNNIGSCQSLVGTTLAANQTVQCTYTETLSQAGSSPFVNTATLTYDAGGNDVVSNDSTVNFPGLSVKKSSTTSSVTAAGQVVPYSYLVTNTGTSSVSGIVLTDTNTDAAPSCPASTLAVGANMTCSGQHTVTQAEMDAGGNLTNTVTATSNEAPDATDNLAIPIQQSPAMTLKKSSTTTSANSAGQVIPYSYLVKNTGNVTLTGVTVADNNTDSQPVCPQSTLAPGASETCTAQHTVTQAEMNAGVVNNTANATSDQGAKATDHLSIPAFGFSAGGTFVVGDLTVGPLAQATGKSVYFWGSQWWKNNQLSGGTGPAAFKGFENSLAKPACGINWTSQPGNSSDPPATIPAYMAIIVSTTVTKSGPSIAGDTPHIVIVKTDAGYGPNPGHAGTGTIVSVLC